MAPSLASSSSTDTHCPPTRWAGTRQTCTRKTVDEQLPPPPFFTIIILLCCVCFFFFYPIALAALSGPARNVRFGCNGCAVLTTTTTTTRTFEHKHTAANILSQVITIRNNINNSINIKVCIIWQIILLYGNGAEKISSWDSIVIFYTFLHFSV